MNINQRGTLYHSPHLAATRGTGTLYHSPRLAAIRGAATLLPSVGCRLAVTRGAGTLLPSVVLPPIYHCSGRSITRVGPLDAL